MTLNNSIVEAAIIWPIVSTQNYLISALAWNISLQEGQCPGIVQVLLSYPEKFSPILGAQWTPLHCLSDDSWPVPLLYLPSKGREQGFHTQGAEWNNCFNTERRKDAAHTTDTNLAVFFSLWLKYCFNQHLVCWVFFSYSEPTGGIVDRGLRASTCSGYQCYTLCHPLPG